MLTALPLASCSQDLHIIETERLGARLTSFLEHSDSHSGRLHTSAAFGRWDSLPTVTAGLVFEPLQASGGALQAEGDQISADGGGGVFLAGAVEPATLCVTLIDCCLLTNQEPGVVTAFSGSHLNENLHNYRLSVRFQPAQIVQEDPSQILLVSPAGGTGVG